MIARDLSYVFIRVPKTASTSICRAMSTAVSFAQFFSMAKSPKSIRNHPLPGQLDDLFEGRGQLDKWRDAYKFGYIRNTWSRRVSTYLWMLAGRRYSDDFEMFVDGDGAYVNDDIRQLFLRPCSDWFEGIDAEVLSYENIDEEFTRIRDKIGLPNATLPRVNVSKAYKLSDFYDECLWEKVREQYISDVVLGGYEDWTYESTMELTGGAKR